MDNTCVTFQNICCSIYVNYLLFVFLLLFKFLYYVVNSSYGLCVNIIKIILVSYYIHVTVVKPSNVNNNGISEIKKLIIQLLP